MRIVVTGSEGGIGTYLVQSLRRRYPDADIVRISRRHIEGQGVLIADLSLLRFAGFAKSALAGADVVVHAAAARYLRAVSPLDLVADDLGMAAHLLLAAREARRLVLLSSATVYGATPEPRETDPLRGESAMAIAKRSIENLFREAPTPAVLWRLFNVVTPLEPHDVPGHVQVDLYRQIVVERKPAITVSGGLARRSFTWVGDVADAMADHLLDDRCSGLAINLGSRDAHTIVELAEVMIRCAKELGLVPPDYHPKLIATQGKSSTPCVDLAESMLGWVAPTTFEACVYKFMREKSALGR